jgi:PhoH-like ATPase
VTKLFVLDTNVLMHDPTSLFRFEEHDIFVPMMTLEELDNNKKGMSEVARNARQASRMLDEIVSGWRTASTRGIDLDHASRGLATAACSCRPSHQRRPAGLAAHRAADNQILAVVMHLQREAPSAGDPGVQGHQHAHQGPRPGPGSAGLLQRQGARRHRPALHRHHASCRRFLGDPRQGHEVLEAGRASTLYRIRARSAPDLLVNEFLYLEDGEQALQRHRARSNGKSAVLSTLIDYSHQKNNVWGITARNREQNFALNLLMDPEIDFVTLLGQAGTGKTLLTLAAGLTQTLETKRYSEIIITRVTVPVGEDIGFLPGTEEEKMTPWMGALEDNLDVLNKPHDEGGTYGGDWGRAATGPDPQPHQGEVAQLHARPHLHQQVPHHRRGAEPHAQADEDPDHPRRPRHQGGLPRQHRPDRHALPHRRQLGPDLRGGPLQGLAAQRPHHPAARRTLTAGRPRGGGVVGRATYRPSLPDGCQRGACGVPALIESIMSRAAQIRAHCQICLKPGVADARSRVDWVTKGRLQALKDMT